MNYAQNSKPYNDDYDPSKNYVEILAVPGRAEQAREFSQIQSIGLDYISRIGNAVYKDGAIINGCELTIKDTTAIITSGSIILGGLVRNVDGTTITISGSGTEYIGAKIVSSIIDEDSDSSLKDPAVGQTNYNQPGAHRLKQTVSFVVNDTDSSILYTLVDGVIQNEAETDSYAVVNDLLAKRTFDENGNYKVNGLNLTEIAGNNLAVDVSSGKGYVKGYLVEKGSSTKVSFDETSDTSTIANEYHWISSASEDSFMLNITPVKGITSITAQVKVIDEPVTRRSPAGGFDYLGTSLSSADQTDLTVTQIHSVRWKDSSTSTTYLYTAADDYQLIGSTIDWSLNTASSKKEPDIGSTYYVTYSYAKKFVLGTDYTLEYNSDDGYYYVKFKNINFTAQTAMYITYTAYLARIDSVVLDKDGNFSVIKGVPDRSDKVFAPINMDDNLLDIGYVKLKPNSTGLSITNYRNERLTQKDLYSMYKRIEDLEYNQAVNDLDNEAATGEEATSLKGIYTDGFIGTTKCDLTHPDFNCCIDYDSGEMTISSTTEASLLSVSESTASTVGRIISAPFTKEVVLSQAHATGSILVNPYSVFNPLSIVNLNPAVDNWVDTNKVTVYNSDTNSTYSTTYQTYSHGWWSVNAAKNLRGLRSSTTTSSTTLASTTTSQSVSTKVSDSLIEYMRSRTITVTGSNFTEEEDNIACTFNGTLVTLTPTGTTTAGTTAGTVKASSSGAFTATFTIPDKVPCGAVVVTLKGATSSGSATYTAKGTLQTTTDTITTTTTYNYKVLVVTENLYNADPAAQSFGFDSDTILCGVGIYFSAKASTKSIVVQVRNMVNGYPGSKVYAAVTLTPDKVHASSDSSAETYVEFNQPVYCNANEQYCFTLLSDSNAYALWYGELGGTDVLTKEVVITQPYATGVLFSSSNATTWTANQSSDLKFNLYKAKYTGSGSILFDTVTTTEMNRLILAAEIADYKNAGIYWYYRYIPQSSTVWTDWYPLDTYTLSSLDSIATSIQLKAELKVAYNTSPLIASDCINLIKFMDGTDATYVSRAIYLSEAYTKLKVAVQFCLPKSASGQSICTASVYYMANGSNWVKLDNTAATTSYINEEFNEWVWSLDTISATNAKSYRIKIVLHTDNPFYRPRARKLRSILKY